MRGGVPGVPKGARSRGGYERPMSRLPRVDTGAKDDGEVAAAQPGGQDVEHVLEAKDDFGGARHSW